MHISYLNCFRIDYVRVIMAYNKIAVIKSGAIGDVLMTTPFLACLRRTFPGAEICYITGKWSAGILEDNPDVDRIIAFDQDALFRGSFLKKISLFKKLRARIIEEEFDMCFVMDKSWIAGFFARACGIPERIGFARGWEGIFLTKTVIYERVKHEIQYYIDLLAYFTKENCSTDMRIAISQEDKKLAGQVRRRAGTGKLLAFALGGGNPGQDASPRNWPFENFARLAEMASSKDWKIVCLGKAGNIAGRNVQNLAGETTIKEAAAILSVCDAIVTGDSGLMHIASAVGIPVVSIFGPTDPRRKAPLNGKSAWLWRGSDCTKCELYGKYCSNHPLTSEIIPEEVMNKLEAIL